MLGLIYKGQMLYNTLNDYSMVNTCKELLIRLYRFIYTKLHEVYCLKTIRIVSMNLWVFERT
ncbi:hypothetical protein Hanom_Chr03g00264641 [Helianthus anomalus]